MAELRWDHRSWQWSNEREPNLRELSNLRQMQVQVSGRGCYVNFLYSWEPTSKKWSALKSSVKKVSKPKAVSTFSRNSPNEIHHNCLHFVNFKNGRICSHGWSKFLHHLLLMLKRRQRIQFSISTTVQESLPSTLFSTINVLCPSSKLHVNWNQL